MTIQDKTNNERQRAFRARQREMGRRRAEFWVTDAERALLERALLEIRNKN